MKKIILSCVTAFALFSCNQEPESAKTEPANIVEIAKKTQPTRTIHEMQMDSVYNNTIESVNFFVDIHKDTEGGLEDVWWDSKNPADQPFKRVRLCKSIGDALIIERRPFPFDENLEVLGYLISKEYKEDSSYVYFIESSRFKKNVEVEKSRERIYLTTLEEMITATEIFRKRLKEAGENISELNGRHENQNNIQLMSKKG